MTSSTQAATLNASQVLGDARDRGERAWEIAKLFPAQGKWSEEDDLGLETNCLVE